MHKSHNLDSIFKDLNLDKYRTLNITGDKDMPTNRKPGWSIDEDGVRKHYNEAGKLHCDTGPAEMRPNGCNLYYRNGLLHRDGGQPAMIGVRGTYKYAVDGQYHRAGGLPAVVWSKGPFRQEWWVNGEISKAERRDGMIEFYGPGCTDRDEAYLHRVDGPARIHPGIGGPKEWWVNGQQYATQAEWLRAVDQYHADVRLEKDLIDEDPIEPIDAFNSWAAEPLEPLPETVRMYNKPVNANTTAEVKKEKKSMNTKPSFMDMMKTNAVDAGYRVAGTQLTAAVKTSIVNIMRNKGSDNNAIQGISAFLDTEFGAAFIAFAIGAGLNYVPHFNEDRRVERLANELRTNGMATVGNAVIGEAVQHLLPAITDVIKNLPDASKEASNVRFVEETKEEGLVEALEQDNEEEEVVAPKVAKV